MPDPPSPCGAWRATVHRLGAEPEPDGGFGVLARVEEGGTVTVFLDGRSAQPGIGAWRSAGRGRVLVVAEWLLDTSPHQPHERLTVRAAAELSDDGRTCQMRLQWQSLTRDGVPLGAAVAGEALGTRLEP